MRNDEPIRLKAEDSPSPRDPQEVGIELMAELRSLVFDALQLRDLITQWGANPVTAHRRAQSRSVELHETAGRALDIGEELIRAIRSARVFSVTTFNDFGVRDGR